MRKEGWRWEMMKGKSGVCNELILMSMNEYEYE
jgi:hypothetical protein